MSSIATVDHVIFLDKDALESNELDIVQVVCDSSLGRDRAKSHDGLIFEAHQLSTHGISSRKPRKTNKFFIQVFLSSIGLFHKDLLPSRKSTVWSCLKIFQKEY